MADTRKAIATLQSDFADNSAGAITAQLGRDAIVTAHPTNHVQTAAFASIPGSGQIIGDLFYPSDGNGVYRWSGSAWVPWGPVFPFADPTLQTWAWVNQGSAAVNTTNGGICLSAPSNGVAYGIRLRKKAAPATPYTITAALVAAYDTSGFMRAGIGFRESSSGKQALFHFELSTNFGRIIVDKMTDESTFSASYLALNTTAWGIGSLVFMRIADNGTNRICSLSADGQNWSVVHTVGRTDFLTANEVGFSLNPYAAAGAMTLLSWKEA